MESKKITYDNIVNTAIKQDKSGFEIINPEPNEAQLLADILGSSFKELQTTAATVIRKQVENLVKNLLNVTMLSVNHVNQIDRWFEAVFSTTTSLYDLGLTIQNYMKIEEKKEIREKRFKRQAKKLRKELIEMMIDEEPDDQKTEMIIEEEPDDQTKSFLCLCIGLIKKDICICKNCIKRNKSSNKEINIQKIKEDNFQRATRVYLARYYATYFIDEISYDYITKKNKNVRVYASIDNYKEYFTSQGTLSEKIDKQRSKLVEFDSKVPELKSSCFKSRNYVKYVEHIVKKDYKVFVKQDKREEFELKYKLFRAYTKQGEFEEQTCFGDQNEVRRTLLCTFFLGLGIMPGIYYGIERIKNEMEWKKNKAKLKETMRTYLKVETKINLVIEKKYPLEKLQYYNKLTKSKYGTFLLEKNLEALRCEFINEECEKKFNVAFELLQKMSCTGIADRLNYVHFNIQYKKGI